MIQYSADRTITSEQFIDILKRSTLSERRPVDQPERIKMMLEHANILITAWDAEKLVGVSRALSDFSYCCYLSDLAVDTRYQKNGIGKKLVELTREIAGKGSALILLAAPAAMDYYPKIGMDKIANGFIIPRQN